MSTPEALALPTDPRVGGSTPGAGRVVGVANLKTVMVAWIILGHALLGYTLIGGWPYDEVQEVTMPPAAELLVTVVMGPSALFIIGTFFFLAGLFAPHELGRRGRGGFVRTRLLRLGVPWAVTMVTVRSAGSSTPTRSGPPSGSPPTAAHGSRQV